MSASSGPLRPSALEPVELSGILPGAPAVAVSGICLDSRSVVPGDLYVALPGETTHGARYLDQAVAAGAAAVLTDKEGVELAGSVRVPVAVVPDPRAVMASLAAQIYHRPADQLRLIGVTGTTGKTSTTFLTAAGLTAAGHQVGSIGTIGFRLGERQLASSRTTITTPEAPDLHGLLAYLLQAGADAVTMEVSSHALALHRADGLVFDVAAFTNLGSDHLDFHHDQESYFQAKASLFRDGRCRAAVIGIDEDYGIRLAAEVRARGDIPVVTTGRSPQADYRVVDGVANPSGSTRMRLDTPSGRRQFDLGLIGDFSLLNAATAAAVLEVAGIDLDEALPGFAEAAVPGRMQRVNLGEGGPNVVVDFAHTAEAVRAALTALPPGRRIAVLGCGGDRDHAKRAPMGAAAAERADVVVVTDDNPRSEDPAAIRAEVLRGARRAAEATGAEVLDGGGRADAIAEALRRAEPGDWIAVLGKGHEHGQQLADRTIPFDDVSVAIEEWARIKGERCE